MTWIIEKSFMFTETFFNELRLIKKLIEFIMATPGKEERFMAIVDYNRQLICRVCYMYATDDDHFKDLYQEVLASLWQGLESFRGDSKVSTWIYRTAINTCVTFYRHYKKHSAETVPLEAVADLAGDDSYRQEMLKEMYRLISCLNKMDKALILMWLDEQSYDEIAEVTGLTRNNVATRLRRIKQRLVDENRKEE